MAEEVILQMTKPDVQDYVTQRLLPFIRENLNAGIVADIRTARTGKSGAVIRNQDTGEETLRTDLSGLPDVHSFLTEVSTRLRKDKDLG